MSPDIKNESLFRQACYVGGSWRDVEKDGNRFDVVNPSTREVIGAVPALSENEVQRCIEDAKEAFATFSALTAAERANLLFRWYDAIIANKEDLAKILTAEQGKPLDEARGEIVYSADFVRWFAEEARRVYGQIIPSSSSGSRISVLKQPIGVCGAITPWNFPSAMITRKVAPALAVGCTVVLKPSELTPFSAMALAVLAEEAGFPKGVLNVVTGNAAMIGRLLCGSESVRKISFTGSTRVGKLLLDLSASSVKKLSLELGGNAPLIVFADSDLDHAADETLKCKLRNTGQTCVCANRIYVQDEIYDAFCDKIVERVDKLIVGDGFAAGSQLGPLINEAAIDKVTRHIADACEKGARILCGGALHEKGGTFFQPTVLADVPKEAIISGEETFGPVVPLYRFNDEREAIALANATEYGLASYFFTADSARMTRVSEALEAGIVGINETAISNVTAPFGGVKQSGLGREGSSFGIDEYLELKYCLRRD